MCIDYYRNTDLQEQLWDISVTNVKAWLSPEIVEKYCSAQKTGLEETIPETQTTGANIEEGSATAKDESATDKDESNTEEEPTTKDEPATAKDESTTQDD